MRTDQPRLALAPRGDLTTQIGSLQTHDHICLVYENAAEQMAAAVPFIRYGLERGECCAYIADDRTSAEVVAALTAGGVDVPREQDRGALVLLTKRDAYLRDGVFDARAMVEYLQETVGRAVETGFTGFRVTGEMTWALGPETDSAQLIAYEALLNQFFPAHPAIAICQYNRSRFPPTIIRDVLRTHPIAVLGDEVCPNLYYEPPELILGEQDEGHRVTWMIDQLKLTRAAQITLADALAESERLQAELEAVIGARDEFLSIAAHELKTPVTSVKGYAQSLARQLAQGGPIDPERLSRALEVIDRQASRLARLVNNLLEVARLRTGRLVLDRKPVDVSALVAQAAESAQATTTEHRVAVARPPELRATVDPSRFEHVVSHLLENAVKYSPEGGTVDVVLRQPRAGSFELAVRDWGMGIAPEHRAQLFEPMFRAHVASHESGLGLGLYLCQQIVQAHGGTMTAEFPEDGGTRMIVRLPVDG